MSLLRCLEMHRLGSRPDPGMSPACVFHERERSGVGTDRADSLVGLGPVRGYSDAARAIGFHQEGEDVKVKLDLPQSRALAALRGLPARAHMLIMCARPDRSGDILEGTQDDFDELVEHISSEFAEGMVSARDAPLLYAICIKIDPNCAEWLGM